MPSFSLLDEQDIEALIDYVIYLSVRGEVERRLLMEMVTSLGYGVEPLPENERLSYAGRESVAPEILVNVQRVMSQWADSAQPEVLPQAAPEMKLDQDLSVTRGRELFHGKIANCVGCHGVEGAGGVETRDYDDWTKEYTTKLGISPDNREDVQPFREVGAHRPRLIQPRILQGVVFRGGDEPGRLYQLIRHGIAGTPMPGVALVPEENGKGLTESQIWDLVSYLRSLRSN